MFFLMTWSLSMGIDFRLPTTSSISWSKLTLRWLSSSSASVLPLWTPSMMICSGTVFVFVRSFTKLNFLSSKGVLKMALLRVFSILDVKVAAYARPFFAPTDGAALRAFSDAVRAPDSDLSRHAADYSLYCLGTFDEGSGALSSLPAPVYVSKAADHLVDQVSPSFKVA